MIDIRTLVSSIILFTALAIPGYILGRKNLVNGSESVGLSNILTMVAIPGLVLSKLLETNIIKLGLINLFACVVVPVISTSVLGIITKVVFKNKYGANVKRICSIFQNGGFLCIPLAQMTFPDNPEIVAYVSITNIFGVFLMLTYGEYLLSGDLSDVKPLKILKKPIFWAIVIGSILSAFEINIPILVKFSGYIADLTTPLAMIVLGIQLSNFKIVKIFTEKSVYSVSFIQLILTPVFTFILLKLLQPFVSANFIVGAFLLSAVPTASAIPAMASAANADANLAAKITLGCTLFFTVTMPFMSIMFDWIF